MTANGKKPLILLEELGLDYELCWVSLSKGENLTEGFRALTPYAKIPVLEDEGLTIWESGAILLYLAEKTGRFLPADPRGRWAAIQLAFFQVGGVGPFGGQVVRQLRKPPEERNVELLEWHRSELNRAIDALDTLMADGRPFVAGEAYSIADIMLWPWLSFFFDRGYERVHAPPRLLEWSEGVGQREAVQRALARDPGGGA